MANDEIDTDESSFRVENVYHTAHVQKDYPHEVGYSFTVKISLTCNTMSLVQNLIPFNYLFKGKFGVI